MATKIFSNVVLISAFLGLCGCQLQPSGLSRSVADQKFLKNMMRGKFSDDPEVAVECFKYYNPVLCDIAGTFRDEFIECGDNARNQLVSLNESMSSDRYQIEVSADGICVRIDNCNRFSGSLNYFDCVANQGRENTHNLYNLAEDASEIAANIRQKYHRVEVEKCECRNASERAYVERAAKTYDELDLCLQNGSISPTENPVTSTETTIATTANPNLTTTTIASTNDDTTTWSSWPPISSTTTPPEVGPPEGNSNRGLKILPRLRSFFRSR